MKILPVLLAVVLAGLSPVGRMTAAAPPPRAAATAMLEHAAAPLAAAQRALDQAIESLSKASTDNKGGFVELARADLEEARLNVANCLAFVTTHPELNSQAAAPSSEISAISARVSDFNVASRPNHAPNLRIALSLLQTALAYLQQTPAGERYGSRDRAIASISRAVSDLIAGINYVTNPDVPGRGTPAADRTKPTLYRGMLGSYGGKQFPFYILSVPNGSNIWGEAAKKKLNGKWDMRQAPQQFEASGSFQLADKAKIRVEAGRGVTVVIDGLGYDLSNEGKLNGIEIAMAAGLHSIKLSVGNNGGQLAECSVKITGLPDGNEVPVFVTESEVGDWLEKMSQGSQELSDWSAVQSRLSI